MRVELRHQLPKAFQSYLHLLPLLSRWQEIIREKILTNYTKEIPYCTEVVIDEFKESEHLESSEREQIFRKWKNTQIQGGVKCMENLNMVRMTGT